MMNYDAILNPMIFNNACRNAQLKWEGIERLYRDHDGNIIDHDQYNELYIKRLVWVMEEIFSQASKSSGSSRVYYRLARFLVEETAEYEDELSFTMFYIEDEADDLYKVLCDIAQTDI